MNCLYSWSRKRFVLVHPSVDSPIHYLVTYCQCPSLINFNKIVYLIEIALELNHSVGQLADKPTRGQSSRGLDNSRTGQLADSEFLKIIQLLYFICTLNQTLTLNLTLSNIHHHRHRIAIVGCRVARPL